MKYIYIGNIVNTHGIKGEVRILYNLKYKENFFINNFKIYIGNKKEEQIINTYRVHKMFDMITLKGFNSINDVLKFKGMKVYINKEDLNIDGYFDEEIIGLSAYVDSKYIGKVTEIMKNINYDILVIKDNQIKNLVPNLPEFIEKIDLENNKIMIKNIEGLINEN